MQILVTGATGFIGTHLVRRLLSDGHRVRCLSRHVDASKHVHGHSSIEYVKADITAPETLVDATKGVDVAFHLAAAGHVSAVSAEAFDRFFEVNVRGTKNIISACVKNGVHRFIHFSSTAAMGLPGAAFINEKTPCNPQSPYQKSKYYSEIEALENGRRTGLEVIVLRPCLVYGPGGGDEFLKLCRMIKRGFFPRIGLGPNLTPIVHVADVVQASLRAIHHGQPGKVYLIASKTSLPLQRLHQLIIRSLAIRRVYFYVPFWIAYALAFLLEKVSAKRGTPPLVSRKNMVSVVTDRTFDISRAEEEIGYHPAVSLEDGIRETIGWYKANHRI